MKYIFQIVLILMCSFSLIAQEKESYNIKGQVLNAANDKPLFNANIININTVKGTVSK